MSNFPYAMMRFVLCLCFLPLISAQEFTTGMAARLIIGQKNYTEQDPISTQSVIGSTTGVAYASDTLYLVDANRLGATPNNNRVLIYRNVSSFVPPITAELPQGTRCPACVGTASVVLGQKDFVTNELVQLPAANNLRNPIGVASSGSMLAVADTENNRILIWRGVPGTNQAPANLVIGQKDMTTSQAGLTASGLRGPQGVWFDPQGGLWVADSGNNRVLYYGIPTQNGQEARLVLGQKDFTSNPLNVATVVGLAQADNMLTPTSVTTDGTRLFVADLGFNRVLIWNRIPQQNGERADVVVGQKDMISGTANKVTELCESTGLDTNGAKLYPQLCGATLSFPRFALSDGRRLFISDSGNDRVLVYDRIPLTNGRTADAVLGQLSLTLNQASDSAEPLRVSASDAFRTPASLAWDGTNLYVSDTFNRRVLIYTPGDYPLPITAVRNSASPEVYAVGGVTVGGEPTENDEVSILIAGKEYKQKVVKDDTLNDIAVRFVLQINEGAGDPNALATRNGLMVVLTARKGGAQGNEVTLEVKTSATSKTTLTSTGSTLTGGQDAARIAPFTLVSILGENLSDETLSVSLTETLPTELGGVQVYFDGTRAPIQSVSPTQINAQLPVDVVDANSAAAIVRTKRRDGRVTVSSAIGVPVIGQNPGIYAESGPDPRPGVVLHYSSRATGTVSVDGTAQAGDEATVIIDGRRYKYLVQANDTLTEIMNGLVKLINDGDPLVEAYPSGTFTRLRLRARVEGPEGNGIQFRAETSLAANVILTPTNTELCCANQAGALVTDDNPALPGETVVVLATGLGAVKPDPARAAMSNGVPYAGPELNEPVEFVSSLAGGRTANVLYAGLRRGVVGIYEVHLELNSDLRTNPLTQLTIAQSFQVSNIVTIPVVNPKAPE